MKYLIDTDWLIDLFGGAPLAERTLREIRRDGVGVSIISRAEIFEGAFGFPDVESTLASYRRFLSQFKTLPISDPVAEVFGRVRSELRRSGQGIQDLDLLIGSTAVHHDLSLLTRNVRHFERIPGLRNYQPT